MFQVLGGFPEASGQIKFLCGIACSAAKQRSHRVQVTASCASPTWSINIPRSAIASSAAKFWLLERQGVEIMRIALRGWTGEVVDEEDRVERKRTRYVLREGAPALLLALARMLLTRPVSLVAGADCWHGEWAAARSDR